MTVIWNMIPCRKGDSRGCFRETFSLHPQDLPW